MTSKYLISILMRVFNDDDKLIEVLFKCFKKLKIFQPLALQLNEISTKHMELPGFFYFPDIIDSDLSNEIISFLNDQEWKGVSISENSRKVQQYGYEYDYISRKGSDYKKIQEIPELLMLLQQMGLHTLEELLDENDYKKCPLNQCIVNKYEPKQGISAHIDKVSFGPAIVCFTLNSGTTMTFSRINNGSKEVLEYYVEPNSVYIMTGESRYRWKHEIKSRLSDGKIRRKTRISITFRSVTQN